MLMFIGLNWKANCEQQAIKKNKNKKTFFQYKKTPNEFSLKICWRFKA